MGTFTLDVSKLGGPGESITKQRLEGYSRWHQFKITQTDDEDFKLIGVVVYVVTAGQEKDGV